MSRYDAAPALAGLKHFQRATVDHVTDRFYGAAPTSRFLVADETGLGKSLVARGVIARTLEHLEDDDTVDRVDVVYVCSNQDIAAQNIARLRVTADEPKKLPTRLTLLGKHSATLASTTATVGKPINLVALTPGTSFDRGWRTGKAEERAMLYLLLERAGSWDGWRRRAAVRALQGTVQTPERFKDAIDRLRAELTGRFDERISNEFLQLIRESGDHAAFEALLDDIGRRATLPHQLKQRCTNLIGNLRMHLAHAGVQTLEPDLIILDEFQRFRHLLSVEEGGDSAELAHHLFGYGNAKVLLLSATPYKPFTLAEESQAGDDHHRDFLKVLEFLSNDPQWHEDVTRSLAAYREGVVRDQPLDGEQARLRDLLLQVMCRTERPPAAQNDMFREQLAAAEPVPPEDMRGFVALRRIAKALDAPATMEYWKSAPYFLNFTEGYQVGDKLRKAARAGDGQLADLLQGAQLLDREALGRYQPVEFGNGRLRRLAENTVDRGWSKLLWVPPSMPYHQLGEPFAAAEGMTKQLLFSSWTATPTAVAGLLSYEAERQLASGHLTRNDPETRRRVASRLDYRLDGGRPAAMSTLALFWPHPELARLCDPLALARRDPERRRSHADALAAVRSAIIEHAPGDLCSPAARGETPVWEALFRWPGALPAGAEPTAGDIADALAGRFHDQEESAESSGGLSRHVQTALDTINATQHPVAAPPEAVGDELALLGMHAPGNVAWRALGRLLGSDASVSPETHWNAAAVLAGGLRSLFNRLESTLLLDQLGLDDVYWRSVLRYAAAGDLQATLDEYLHHLRSAMGEIYLDDDGLVDIAATAAEALSLRAVHYQAFDPVRPNEPIRLLSRFALRYGGRHNQVEDARQPEVRNAFNSPFWPFVLATTSVGQEGIDFHWWCSSVVHWNTPPNPVDFEQREGRVHRFGGHAVRRNVAAAHRSAALTAAGTDVWANAYDAAHRESSDLGDFSPYWIYPGEAKIERHVMPYPLSRDTPQARTSSSRSGAVPAGLRAAAAGGHAGVATAQRGQRRRSELPDAEPSAWPTYPAPQPGDRLDQLAVSASSEVFL